MVVIDDFVKIFEEYGFTVEKFGDMSYIADNGIICVPFTIHPHQNQYSCFSDIAAVSFLSEDKDAIKAYYKSKDIQNIGDGVWSDYANRLLGRRGFMQFGGIGKRDYAPFEIRNILDRTNRRKNIK